jgi:hypothetical protein
MEYLLLIYHTEKDYAKMPEAEKEPMHAEYRKLMEQLSANGNYRGGHQLTPTGSATTVRVRDGKRVLTNRGGSETGIQRLTWLEFADTERSAVQ